MQPVRISPPKASAKTFRPVHQYFMLFSLSTIHSHYLIDSQHQIFLLTGWTILFCTSQLDLMQLGVGVFPSLVGHPCDVALFDPCLLAQDLASNTVGPSVNKIESNFTLFTYLFKRKLFIVNTSCMIRAKHFDKFQTNPIGPVVGKCSIHYFMKDLQESFFISF